MDQQSTHTGEWGHSGGGSGAGRLAPILSDVAAGESTRVLELRLQQVRAAAAAARWEAEAAQLELLLLQHLSEAAPTATTAATSPSPLGLLTAANAGAPAGENTVDERPGNQWPVVQGLGDQGSGDQGAGDQVAGSQGAMQSDQSAEPDLQAAAEALIQAVRELAAGQTAALAIAPAEQEDAAPEPAIPVLIVESPAVRSPEVPVATKSLVPTRLRSEQRRPSDAALEPNTSLLLDATPLQDARARRAVRAKPGVAAKRVAAPKGGTPANKAGAAEGAAVATLDVAAKLDRAPKIATAPKIDEAAVPAKRRGRPAAWLVSSAAHGVALALLSLVSLAAPKVRDQLAFTASAASPSEQLTQFTAMESAADVPELMESGEPEEAAADSAALPLVDWDSGAERMSPAMMAEGLTADTATSAVRQVSHSLATAGNSMQLGQPLRGLASGAAGQAANAVQFAGIAGGGNHFVYLVDSSHSMLKFAEARAELLRSIEALKADQRFYVVFYDEQPKYMCISHPGRQEAASVYATPPNKQSLRNWAMTVTQQRGQSPPDVLRFAFELRPDVIFLLSDGEFSARTETVIREGNQRSNLFGESGQLSIIHTIRFPGASSTEGRKAEQQMQRIAQENGGQYRNVAF